MKKILIVIYFLSSYGLTLKIHSQTSENQDELFWNSIIHQTIQSIIYEGSLFGDIRLSIDNDSTYIIHLKYQELNSESDIFRKIWECNGFDITNYQILDWGKSSLNDYRTNKYGSKFISEIPEQVKEGKEIQDWDEFPAFIELHSIIQTSDKVLLFLKSYTIGISANLDGRHFYHQEKHLITFQRESSDKQSERFRIRSFEYLDINLDTSSIHSKITGGGGKNCNNLSIHYNHRCCSALKELLTKYPDLRKEVNIPGF